MPSLKVFSLPHLFLLQQHTLLPLTRALIHCCTSCQMQHYMGLILSVQYYFTTLQRQDFPLICKENSAVAQPDSKSMSPYASPQDTFKLGEEKNSPCKTKEGSQETWASNYSRQEGSARALNNLKYFKVLLCCTTAALSSCKGATLAPGWKSSYSSPALRRE